MQSPAAAAASSLPRHVVRLSAALAALCGHQENEEVLCDEDQVLGKLRAATLALSTAAEAAAAAGVAGAGAATASAMLAALLPGVATFWRDTVYEERVLGRLREAGLITYPSPLLGRLIEIPAVFAAEVLPRVDPTGRGLIARVGRASRAMVVASSLPRAGASVGVPLKIQDFVRSVELLAWAKENGCPWIARTCAVIAEHGDLQVLRRARELDCPW